MNRQYTIIVAGGRGLRMGGSVPKQFMILGEEPVLMRTMRTFRQAIPDLQLIAALPASQHEYWQKLCEQFHFDIPVMVVEGGETRYHSVKNALAVIPSGTEGLVGVHDGVRPFVSPQTIVRCYSEAASSGTAVPVTPVVDTLRRLDDASTSHTEPRNQFCLVQTPQVFDIKLLQRAYGQEFREDFTDDASVVEALGVRVTLVEGNRENIKLTTQSDLRLAQGLLHAMRH